MTFSDLHHPQNPSAHRAMFLYPGPVEGQGIMGFLTVHKVQAVEYKVQSTEYKVQSTEYKL